MAQVMTLELSTAKCRAEKTLLGILWPLGSSLFPPQISPNSTYRSQRLLNPLGNAYRSETGGLMEALRVLSVERSISSHLFIVPL